MEKGNFDKVSLIALGVAAIGGLAFGTYLAKADSPEPCGEEVMCGGFEYPDGKAVEAALSETVKGNRSYFRWAETGRLAFIIQSDCKAVTAAGEEIGSWSWSNAGWEVNFDDGSRFSASRQHPSLENNCSDYGPPPPEELCELRGLRYGGTDVEGITNWPEVGLNCWPTPNTSAYTKNYSDLCQRNGMVYDEEFGQCTHKKIDWAVFCSGFESYPSQYEEICSRYGGNPYQEKVLACEARGLTYNEMDDACLPEDYNWIEECVANGLFPKPNSDFCGTKEEAEKTCLDLGYDGYYYRSSNDLGCYPEETN